MNRLYIFLISSLFTLSVQAQNEFRQADSIAMRYPNHSIQDLKLLSERLTNDLPDDTQKFRAIYRWVCENISNDYTLYALNKRKREKLKYKPDQLEAWNRQFTKRVTKKLLEDHSTVCTGYAYLIKELAYHADINCVMVDGYGRTAHANIGGPGYANHSWNAVQLNGTWHLCDATWSSGEIDPTRSMFIKKFNPDYFLSDPAFFIRNHYPLDTSFVLTSNLPTLREFLDRPLIYKAAYHYRILPDNPETFHVTSRRGEKLEFQFHKTDQQSIDNIQMQLIYGGESSVVHPKISQPAEDEYLVEHIFSRNGTWVVHFLINNEFICTYEVKVGKKG